MSGEVSNTQLSSTCICTHTHTHTHKQTPIRPHTKSHKHDAQCDHFSKEPTPTNQKKTAILHTYPTHNFYGLWDQSWRMTHI